MKELTILSTTDVHGFLTAAGKKSGIGALSAVAGQFHEPILIDNGDFFVGSPETTFFNTTQKISPLTTLANEIGFDVMVPGNHDFDYGLAFLKRQAAAFNGKYLCANVLDAADQLIFEPYTLLERDSVKVGVIGVVTSAMSQIADYEKIKDLKFVDVIETLKKWVPVVREQADLVIVSYHGGVERNMIDGSPTQYDTGEDQAYRIIDEVQSIDGLICGHQHRINAGILNETAFVQPGYRANVIGQLTFRFDEQLQEKTAELIETESETALSLYDSAAYEQWLQTELDLTHFADYLARKVPSTFYAIELKGQSVADFLASFTPPYTLSTYHVSYEELKEILKTHTVKGIELIDGQLVPTQSDYRITTNLKTFPAYRLETNYIFNVFDEYLAMLSEQETN
ncbi:2,' 3'-cyclic nucleotide 2'-phosphodiesterase [Erwinia sp. CPCC 100877]|nr:2,' 3'-cyclic nucleotide 2'-phosphodiesterase [Erwinia sp. CPCC 100877]